MDMATDMDMPVLQVASTETELVVDSAAIRQVVGSVAVSVQALAVALVAALAVELVAGLALVLVVGQVAVPVLETALESVVDQAEELAVALA